MATICSLPLKCVFVFFCSVPFRHFVLKTSFGIFARRYVSLFDYIFCRQKKRIIIALFSIPESRVERTKMLLLRDWNTRARLTQSIAYTYDRTKTTCYILRCHLIPHALAQKPSGASNVRWRERLTTGRGKRYHLSFMYFILSLAYNGNGSAFNKEKSGAKLWLKLHRILPSNTITFTSIHITVTYIHIVLWFCSIRSSVAVDEDG